MKAANEAHFAATTEDADGQAVMTRKHKLILTLFGGAFLVMVYGVIPWEDLGIDVPTLWWWFPEMTASFLLFAILIGIVGGMKEEELTTTLRSGREPSVEQQEEYESLAEKLQQLTTYQRVAAAQANFERLMARINEEIGRGLEAGEQSRIILP